MQNKKKLTFGHDCNSNWIYENITVDILLYNLRKNCHFKTSY